MSVNEKIKTHDFYYKALMRLRPGAEFTLFDDLTLQWDSTDISQPTQDEIDNELTILEQERNEAIANKPSKRIRAKRDSLLTNTDWVVIKYKELGKEVPAAWKNYRQALRDITEQEGFPHDVTFPEEPTES